MNDFYQMCKHPLIIYAILATLSLICFVTYRLNYQQEFVLSIVGYHHYRLKLQPKVILFWTPFFGNPYSLTSLTVCSELRCRLTNDRSEENHSSAILFHIRDFNWRDLPAHRKQWQRYVFELYESPHHTFADLAQMEGFFNWTMTYRMDSDVPSPYGRLLPLNEKESVKNQTPESLIPLIGDKGKILDIKKKPVVWMVSNCGTPSKREAYVEELKKHIPVDIYGACSNANLKCSKSRYDECNKMISETYRFYLAFENSLCKDYVTEKLYSRAFLNSVPIVMKRNLVANLLPEHSFVAADDFAHPKFLAEYLRKLLSNDTLYMEYFAWKLRGYVNVVDNTWPSHYSHYCLLCQKLWSPEEPAIKIRKDLRRWWFEDAHCDTGFVDKQLKMGA